MDVYKTGRFIARLRRERDLTQEALGELLGVSGKTVSRWERGVYMPDLSMLEALSATFSVTADELIAGERQMPKIIAANAENASAPDEDIDRKAKRDDAFTLSERIAYFKRKWKRDHALYLAVCAVGVAAVFVCGVVFDIYPLGVGAAAAAIWFYMRERGEMMTYVESRAFTEESGGEDKNI